MGNTAKPYFPFAFLLGTFSLQRKGTFAFDELYYQVQQRIEEKEEVHMNLW